MSCGPTDPAFFQVTHLISGQKNIIKNAVKIIRADRIKYFADVIVGRDFTDLKKAVCLGEGTALPHSSLEKEKRGALSEEDREGRLKNVDHGIVNIGTSAEIRKRLDAYAQSAD